MVDFYSFLDREVSYQLCVHIWHFRRTNLVTPRELTHGGLGLRIRAISPTLELTLVRWRFSKEACAIRNWSIRTSLSQLVERFLARQTHNWWGQVLRRAGMDPQKMKAMVMQRWSNLHAFAAIYAWCPFPISSLSPDPDFQPKVCILSLRTLTLTNV